MADAFAPQFQGDVRFNQPTEQPSTLGAVADLASMFSRSFSSAQDNKSSSAPKTNPDLDVFRQGLELVEAIRDEKGEAAGQIAERQLASNFAARGVSFGKEYEDVYTTTTGRQWQGYGQDVEATMMQEALKDEKVQALYIASYAVNKDWNNEQRVQYAIGQQAQLLAQENEIIRSKSEAGYKWSIQTEASYIGAADTFVNQQFGALALSAQQGAVIGPQDIANLRAEWSQLKQNLTPPPGVSSEQYNAVEKKLAAIDTTIESFDKVVASGTLTEDLTSRYIQSLLAASDGSPDSVFAIMASVKDPIGFASFTRSETAMVEAMNKIKGAIKIDVSTPNLFGQIVESQGTVADPDPNAILTDIPKDVAQSIEGKTPQQIYDGLNASGQLSGMVKPQDLSRPEARQQFTENAATIGSVLMKNPEGDFLSADFIKKLVGNPQFIGNVKALDTLDPEAATVARTYVRSGLSTEKARQQRNLEAIEANLGVTWDGSTYVLDSNALMQKNGWNQQQADGFIAWVGKTYGGDLSKLAKGLVPMPEGMPFQPAGLNQAFERRAAIGVIDQTMKALEVKVEGEATATPTTDVATGAAAAGVVAQTPETYFEVNDQNLPVGGAIVEVGSAKVVANSGMKPLLNSTVGASSLVKPGADTRIAGVLQGPFQTLQSNFGAALVINDGLAKEGTSREKETPGSRHFHGDALDISTAGMSDADKLRLVDAALAAGFQGFGFGNNILHIDLGSKRAWAYGNDSFGGMSVADLKARVQGNATAPASISMDPRVAQPSAGGNLATPEADDKEGAATGFTLLDGSFSVSGGGGGATTEAPATATEAATASLPENFQEDLNFQGTDASQPTEQAPVVDAEVQALIDNLSTKTKRQLKAAGIEPSSLKFFETDAAAEAAIESGELQEGDAYILPNGQVNIVEGD